LFEFIKAVIEPLNQYLTTGLRRLPLSASRLARFALAERQRMAREIERKAKALAKKQLSSQRSKLPNDVAL
jgi:hypothetical protein